MKDTRVFKTSPFQTTSVRRLKIPTSYTPSNTKANKLERKRRKAGRR